MRRFRALAFSRFSRYARGVTVALSTLLNALLGGVPSEPLSCRSARARRAGKRWGCLLCRFLDRIDPDHCERSIKWWEG
ncbi:MAG: hypothetical protein EOR96_34515 [Mesorhizobium sp.]|nr:MAG: hypothetical protein EOR96_34515 [Mesorhizobium sp.]